jgi:tyrocidine synthetase-3
MDDTLSLFPLTHAQKRIWQTEGVYPGTAISNIGGLVKLQNKIEYETFNRAANILISLCDSLRLRIVIIEEEPKQYVSEHEEQTFELLDFSQNANEDEAMEWVKEEANKPYKLIDANLYRISLIKINENYFWIYIASHHMTNDGISMNMLAFELLQIYNELINSKDERPALAAKPSYIDHITNEENYVASTRFVKDKLFWEEQYQTLPDFSSIKPSNPYLLSTESCRKTVTLSKDLYSQLQRFVRQHNTSIYNIFMAAITINLFRLTSLTDLALGTVFANRVNKDEKNMTGMFVSTVPLRMKIEPEDSFLYLVKQIFKSQTSILRHQKYPYNLLINELRKKHSDLERIFGISVLYQAFKWNKVGDLSYMAEPIFSGAEVNDFVVRINEYTESETIYIDVDYRIELFSENEIESFILQTLTILRRALEDPYQSIEEFKKATTDEMEHVLQFNNISGPSKLNKTIHELFEEQVAKSGDLVAVVFGEEKVTYRELNSLANRLAYMLKERGLQPDGIVGILCDRSIEMVVAVLAVLKAGGAYLPIAADYPHDRIHYMLMDSGTTLLLAQPHLKEKLTEDGWSYPLDSMDFLDIIGPDEDSRKMNAELYANMESCSGPENLAYIIYTSGSTGLPKGILTNHMNVTRVVKETNYIDITSDDRMLSLSNYAFDGFTFDLFGALLNGAKLVIAPNKVIMHIDHLQQLIIKEKITVMFVTTALFNLLVDAGEVWMNGMRRVLFGGERASVDHVRKALTHMGEGKIIHVYGPTESTVFATFYPVHAISKEALTIPIGRPLNQTGVYILSSTGYHQPIGVSGELYISGEGVARGYLNRPELTNERFSTDPFTGDGIMYRTGDLAKWLPNGNIEYLGRIDNQVKIRGHRIEPDEIEAQLQSLPGIKEAVVMARSNETGELYLCAYVATDNKQDNVTLRSSLARRLPSYMLPSFFVQMDKLPLTPNGKVDRQALPEPDDSNREIEEYVAPTNEVESHLAEVWQSVLGIERVGIHDHFFVAGGDSIKAIQTVSRLHKKDLHLDIKDIFQYPTIKELGKYVKRQTTMIAQDSIEGMIEPTPIQSWFFARGFQDQHHFNQSVMLHNKNGFDENRIYKVLTELVKHHDALRIRVEGPDNQLFINSVNEDKIFDWLVTDLTRELEPENRMDKDVRELQSSMRLEEGLLFKAGLFKTVNGDYLLLAVHHLVVDGVSWRILLEDIQTSYLQLVNKRAIQLPPKTNSFADWSTALKQHAEGKVLLKQIPYWNKVVNQKIKKLPQDFPPQRDEVQDSASILVELSVQQTQQLLREIQHAYRTEVNDILLTALGLTVREWTGFDQILINLEGHGRESLNLNVDISRTVGWFTTMYPVVLDMSKSNHLPFAIMNTKETLRQIPNKGLGYGVLKYLVPQAWENGLSVHPQPEISFNYLGQFNGEVQNEIFTLLDDDLLTATSAVSERMERAFPLELNAMMMTDQFKLRIGYNQTIYNEQTMQKFANRYIKHLMRIIEHCLQREESELTPADLGYSLLSLERFETLKYQLQQDIDGNTQIQKMYELTPLQKGMLYHSILDESSSVYFEQFDLYLNGHLEVPYLERSLQEIINKYDVLRTVFIYKELKDPLQVVLKQRKAEFHYEDLTGLNTPEQERYLENLKTSVRNQGFDLSKDVLFRLDIIQMSPESYRMLWHFHHILMDGWCIGIIMHDLMAWYRFFAQGVRPHLDEIYPYSDYIRWLNEQDTEAAELYWKRYLEGYEQAAIIPRRNERLNLSYENKQVEIQLDRELLRKVEHIAGKYRVTVNTVFQSVWGLLLSRYNQAADVVFGSVVSGRQANVTGVEQMIGLFINTIPVRINFRAGITFASLLQQVQETALSSSQYDYLSLAQIQSNSALKGGLLDHIVIFENFPLQEQLSRIEKNGEEKPFSVELVSVREQTNYDLNIIVMLEDTLRIMFNFNAEVYEEKMIVGIGEHLKQLFEEAVHFPEQLVSEIAMMTEEEERKIISLSNTTQTSYPKEKSVHILFEEQAKRWPEKVALALKEESLTYRELNEKANQLARQLIHRGFIPKQCVAIMANHSAELIIAILATIKAGGAYVPIDPEYPSERISSIVADCGASFLLTQSFLSNSIEAGMNVILLDDPDIYHDASSNLEITIDGDDIAYVIFTSGTTGRPKGAMITHQGLTNYTWWARKVYAPEGLDFPLYSSISFDLTVTSIFVPLITGNTIVIYNEEDKVSLIRRIVEENKVDIIKLTPTHLHLLLECDCVQSRVTKLIVGGENLNTALAQQVYEKFEGKVHIYNEYGPTETVVGCMIYKYDPEKTITASVPIGLPADNVNIYVLDAHLRPLPPLVSGEIYISGDGVSKGYLNRPELTEEKFVLNPFLPDKLMYRTGDLARWLPDGNLEYLGRMDDQVKIRGYRIELGEIESQLERIQAVKEAIVMAREEAGGTPYLCAYVVSDQELDASELRRILSGQLPSYMIPSFFVQLESMPLTSNGKVNRRALPEPEGRALRHADYVAPRTELEIRLSEIWRSVLGIERVGIKDHFFELGGHSLKATTLAARMHKELQVNVPLRAIFQSPTLEELAEAIAGMAGERYASIEPVEERPHYPVSSAQKRMYILNQRSGAELGYNMPVAYMVEGPLDFVRMEAAFRKLIERHESLRTSFDMVEGEPVQRVYEQVVFHVEHEELTGGEEAAITARMKAFVRPFDLSHAPLLRVGLLKTDRDRHMLLFDMHHIVSDGVSMKLLVDEFKELYAGEELPSLRLRYKDYAVWQRKQIESEAMRKQKAYWLEAFSGEIPVLELPTDFARPAMPRFEGGSVVFNLDKETVDKLHRLASETGATMYMVLLAAYTTLLWRYTGQEDIVVGTPVAGRPHADLEPLLGMFVGMLALRNRPSGDKRFKDYVQEVKEQALRAFENQDYPLEELVENLNIRQESSRNPLFDVMFVMQNMEKANVGLKEMKFIRQRNVDEAAKYDLTLYATETGKMMELSLEYRTSLFQKDTVMRMADQLQQILNQAAERPEGLLFEIEILNEKERKQILCDFNDTCAAYPVEATIPDLFEKQVIKTPEQTAVICGAERLTYGELNQRVNRMARVLREGEAMPNRIVAIIAERSLEMITGILAVLKAGAAYLPIDPESPLERIHYMLEDAGVSLLLIQPHLKKKLQEDGFNYNGNVFDLILHHSENQHLDIAKVESAAAQRTLDFADNDLLDNLECVSKSNDLAYVIYTSGSTGQPKGVMVEHQSLVNRLKWMQKRYPLTKDDIVLQKTPFTFDVSVWELFWWALEGATLCLLEPGGEREPGKVLQTIEEQQVTIMHFVPSMLHTFMEYTETESAIDRLSTLRQVFASGEALGVAHAYKFGELVTAIHGTQLTNLYGPTEATIDVTYYDCRPLEDRPSVPIGRPIDNIRIYVLDNQRRLQPIGVPGEVYIGGVGIARGYLNRPELTAEKFIDDSFTAGVGGGRLYRTGDLARWLPDGNLEYLGRMDDQVKIRGYRIELGEIESQLERIQAVKEAVVIAREEVGDTPYLCAYVVSDQELDASELRRILSGQLPSYMIPSFFVQLESMPLTSNGKVNRRALPEPEGRALRHADYVAPRTELEIRLSEIWRSVLGIERVGIKDHFFELGGHSLKATTLAARMHKELQVNVPLRAIFQSPTLEELAEAIAGMAGERYASIEPVEERPHYPVSSAQKRMYILNQRSGAELGYNMPVAYMVEGPLDFVRMEAAFRKLIERHESLRTSFDMVEGEPVQRVYEQVVFHVEHEELTGGEEAAITARMKAFVRPFDLSHAPLLRVGLLKTDRDRHMLLFDMHHIVSDGVSMKLLVDEFKELYAGEELPSLRLRYKDYAVWQRKQIESEAMRKQKAYWLEAFSGEIPVLELPTDYPRPAMQQFFGGTVTLAISPEVTEGIRRIASETSATMYMVLLAAYTSLLWRYTGQEDIVVGTPVAGRPHADLEPLLGMFVGTLALRNRPSGDKRFKDYVQEVKEQALRAFENQDYPLEELVENLNIRQEPSRNPLFDVMFTMQNMGHDEIDLEDLQFIPLQLGNSLAKFDLTLNVLENKQGLHLSLHYRSSLFQKKTIERLVSHLEVLLGEVAERSHLQLNELQWLTESEREQVLYRFNGTQMPFLDQTIHSLFEAQVEKTPMQVAVVSEEEQVTYAELNGRSNDLARRLREQGVGVDDIVGVLSERSVEMIVAILAVLKAGGAYVPLDPESPGERTRYTLVDAGARLVLVQPHLAAKLAGIEETVGLVLLTEAMGPGEKERGVPMVQTAENATTTNLEPLCQAGNLAYVIYTSGSTGQPKGVMVEHRSLVNLSMWHQRFYQVTEADRVAKYASGAFDASVWELFPYLISGASVYLVPETIRLDIEALQAYYEANGITITWLPPQLYERLLEQDNRSLRLLLTGADKVKGYKPVPYEVWNTYGPTESTVICTAYRIEGEQANIPIGKPLDNTRIYIVDAQLKLQPIGVPGELCIAGAGLARGYLNRPELTAEKFVPNPFEAGERMYRTGDLARWLPDGNLEYLGRIDQQVKIRGYRIELGEIEATLLAQEEVQKAVVVARQDEQGESCLCAYVVAEGEVDAASLRRYASQTLPSYMVPAFIVQLEQLPLTTNGKLDRKALPAPEGASAGLAVYVAPRTMLEAKLAEVWQLVLGVERVGVQDHFFELGGHSLKAATLVSRLHKELGVDLPLRSVFEAPILSEMAQRMEAMEQTVYTAIEPVAERAYYPVSSSQKRMYILNQLEGAELSYNMPGVYTVEGELDVARMERALQALLKRHESLRTSFELVNGEPVQRVHAEVSFQLTQLEGGSEEEADRQVAAFIRPFDLSEAPLFRAGVMKLPGDRHLFVYDMHHIVSDGVSMNVLVEEFSRLYAGEELLPLRLQYKDYAVWQQERLQAEELERQEAYWLETFSGELPVLELPTDYPRPAMQQFAGGTVSFAISPQVAEGLRRIASETGATLYMVLLSAYTVLLSKYSGQEDLVVGTPVAGRPHADLEPIIGMFVGTLALRNRVKREQTFQAYVEDVKRSTLLAFEHADYPLEELVERLDVRRDLSRNPLFDVMFAMQNMNESIGDRLGLAMKPYPTGLVAAKFDLTLHAEETENDGIFCSLEYAKSLFGNETMRRFSDHFLHLVREIALGSDSKIGDLDLASREELQHMVSRFNATQSDYSRDKLVHELFEEQVQRTPWQVAVICGEEEITYHELNVRANSVAQRLREMGVMPDSIVGILVERSIEMVVSTLAVLKAGGGYLPIESDCPKERIGYILADAQAGVVVVQEHLESLLSPSIEAKLLILNEEVFTHGDRSNPERVATDQHLAYVIYTSGSTGQPKGVMVEHKNYLALAYAWKEAYKLDSFEVRLLQIASFSFDVFAGDLARTLLWGGQMVICSNQEKLDFPALFRLLHTHRITIFESTPGLLFPLMQYMDEQEATCDDLRIVIVGSDRVPVSDFNRLAARYGSTLRFLNSYGVTEGCIDSSFYEAESNGVEARGSVPIGTPLPNITMYVVDAGLRVQPIGVPGELCIGGAGVSRGYLNRPELTAEKFVPNPFKAGERMYRTGDLARWLPDGNLEYLGRIDQQVKIRGYRIELGEIEATLLAQEQVQEAVVIARQDEQGEPYLCAYVVVEGEVDVVELRRYAGQTLPNYMLPSFIVQLERLPLTANGKLDRNALPEPEGAGLAVYVAPRTMLETKLAEMWTRVLDVERVGVQDHFFELGGHSLKAATLVSHLHKELGVDLPLRSVFEAPILSEMAQRIGAVKQTVYTAIEPIAERAYYPVSSSQRRMYILNQLEGAGLSYNMPGVYTLEGSLDVEHLELTLQRLLNRHESLRTSFDQVKGEPVQIVHKNVNFHLEIMQAGKSQVQECIESFIRPFDLSKAPLFRVALIPVNTGNHVLVFDTHHIICDGGSMAVLMEEFIRLYDEKDLTDLRIQYRDYAVWQQNMLEHSGTMESEEYWLGIYSNDVPQLQIVTDYVRPDFRNYSGELYHFKLDQNILSGLQNVALQSGATMYMVLFAAYSVLLSKYAGQEDIVVGSPVMGRGRPELDNVVGMFVNTVAIRTYPQSVKSFFDYLLEVKQRTIEAFAHQIYPFEMLVEKLNKGQELNRNPLFDTMFVWQNEEAEPPSLEKIKLIPWDTVSTVSKFDFSLHVMGTSYEPICCIEYSTALFKKSTIIKLATDFMHLLDQIVNNHYVHLHQIELKQATKANTDNKFTNVDFVF